LQDLEPPRSGPRIALLATQELCAADVTSYVAALETAGMRVEVLCDSPAGQSTNGATGRLPNQVSPDDYSALAIPAAAEKTAGASAESAQFLETMRASGKPILYMRAPDPPPQNGAPPRFSLKRLLHLSWTRWNEIDAPRLGAALAYYTLLSLAPLLVLVVSIAGVFFRHELIRSGLIWQVHNIMGNIGTSIVRPVLETARSSTGIIAGIIGILTLLLGASGVFLELRDSLDTVWDVKPPYGSGLWSLVRERLFAFLLVLGTGLVLTLSLLLTTVLSSPIRFVLHFMPQSRAATAGIGVATSLVVMTFIFALIYKVVPDTHIRWGDVWIGALVTAALFTAGKWLIAIYLATASVGSAYAAAGSLIVFLTWVYYSVQIFLFGAAFTHEYALRHGSHSPAAIRRGRIRSRRESGRA